MYDDNINNIILDITQDINLNLDLYLDKYAGKNISEAMKYSLMAGGKRFRPLLILLMAKSVNLKNTVKSTSNGTESIESIENIYSIDSKYKDNTEIYNNSMPFAIAIEFIHTYSLIHDDLPCMDNDDFRRGLLTCHKKFDEATAVLAGDALLNTSFEIMLDTLNSNFQKKFLEATNIITQSAGSKGMIDGQVLDMNNEKLEINLISEEVLLNMYKNKTGKLISASLLTGAVIAEMPQEELKVIKKIGYDLGLAFQIKDDILDIIGDELLIGKPINSDIKNEKSTYIKLHGLEKSKIFYKNLCYDILENLSDIGLKDSYIYIYIRSCFNREF